MSSYFETNRNRIVLKPRFSIEHPELIDVVLAKFQVEFNQSTKDLRGKIVGKLIIVDVPEAEEHFWSPQLQLQLEEQENQSTLIRGHYGPKPNLWTLFMFIHFGVAVVFAIFATKLFTDISLNQEYRTALIFTIAMPVVWILFYLFGRWGKKKGHGQMQELDAFVKEVLKK